MGTGPSLVREFKDSPFSKKELVQLDKVIAKVSGKKAKEAELSLEEFKTVFETWLGKRVDMDKVDLDEIFNNVDTDHSGAVSTRELVTWLAIYQKGTDEDKLTAIFRSFDKDGNDSLDKEEIGTVLEVLKFSMASRGLTESRALANATEMIQKLVTKEKNKGVITLKQWLRIGKQTNLVEDLLGKDFIQLMEQGAGLEEDPPERKKSKATKKKGKGE